VLPLESVPNVSEGRDAAVIGAIGAALAAHATLLDVHSDPDHNRSVFTLVGSEQALQEALVAGVAAAKERIDLRRHEGVHPRVGAADVVPIVPIRPEDMPRAKRTARLLAKRLTAELGLTTFLYGEVGEGRGPRGGRRPRRRAEAVDRVQRQPPRYGRRGA
jgi:glutamate formiminotransferase